MPVEPPPHELVRTARGAAGLSQNELAVRAGVSQTLVCRVERGARLPTLTALARILEGLGLQLRLETEPLWAAVDAACDTRRPVEEVFAEAAEDWISGFDVAKIHATLVEAGIDHVFSGMTAAALLGAPVPLDGCEFVVRRDEETLEAFFLWLVASDASRWDPFLGEYGGVVRDPRVEGVNRWLTMKGIVRADVVDELPPAVVVTCLGAELPVVGLADIESADARTARVLDRMRARLASTP